MELAPLEDKATHFGLYLGISRFDQCPALLPKSPLLAKKCLDVLGSTSLRLDSLPKFFLSAAELLRPIANLVVLAQIDLAAILDRAFCCIVAHAGYSDGRLAVRLC
ncbi:MAG: hypothetical protein JWO89_3378 [Verrucomicrobiaceae bacterium]|nr:hypothetical protein [Verrucomicrobiaceae bacterium]MDB6120906.1 hypothetical protein [Verrucomicrobiaceae bacterium]